MKNKKIEIADVIIYILLSMSALSCLIPLIHVVACAIASPADMASSSFLLFPKEFSFSAIQYILDTPTFPRSLWNSTWTTMVATTFSMIATTLLAYPLAHTDLHGRSLIMFLLVFTMIFNPGLIPGYLNVKRLNLLDTWWSLLIPQKISTYNLILVKNYFQSIPTELRESAKCDGAGDFRIYWQIILPLAKPVLATVALFYAVGNWNSYLNAILFVLVLMTM
ncbi:MAG: carbohydrate ABC transporter permease [Eubacteriales bacterium]